MKIDGLRSPKMSIDLDAYAESHSTVGTLAKGIERIESSQRKHQEDSIAFFTDLRALGESCLKVKLPAEEFVGLS